MTRATAPGKAILFGEHAVVYGRPAIAVPVTQVRATATVTANQTEGVRLVAPDLAIDTLLDRASAQDQALAAAVRQVQQKARLAQLPDLVITVSSDIPIASGLGSGAAVAAATIRALSRHLELWQLCTDEAVSSLTYEVEKIHHGTPSGIDNTVVAYERPVYFMRQQPQNQIETFYVTRPLRLLIGDTGVHSSTKAVVDDVRHQWQADRERFEALFDGCGRIAAAARLAIEDGDLQEIGRLMAENQQLLQEMTVSSRALERLITAATRAGALGAKLSGAGRGGNVIALVTEEKETAVRDALSTAGARTVLTSVINST